MKILLVLTSHDRLGPVNGGGEAKPTGFWLEELAAPYYVFADAGADLTLASPEGGKPPMDPASDAAEAQTEATRRFKDDPAAQQALAETVPLADIDGSAFDAVFFPGGHGPLWDLAEDPDALNLIAQTYAAGKPLALVCHAPGVLANAVTGDNAPLVRGRRVTGFANSEEAAVGLSEVVPFLVEDALKQAQADYSKGEDWASYTVTDGNLITGQNPASSRAAAEAVLSQLHAS